MKQLSTETYESLVEELQACHVEGNFEINELKVKWAHEAGKVIRHFVKDDSITDLLPKLAVDTGIGERTLWRYVQLFDLNPDIKALLAPHGKNITISLLLGTSKEKKEIDETLCNHSCARCCKVFNASHSRILAV